MGYYQEITLMSPPEIPLYFIWSRVYTQLHLALVKMKDSQEKVPVGISFPEYRYQPKKSGHLGKKLRVFSQEKTVLEQLNLKKWLLHLTDYLHLTTVREVASNRVTKYASYRRKHAKGNIGNLARRRAKRHKVSLEEAMHYYQEKVSSIDLPYIQLRSLTTKQVFRLYIEKCEYNKEIEEGFSTYGLSCVSTVPEF